MLEEKIYTSMHSRNAELYHHGIKGQKWGVSNGPPYPLSDEVSTGKRLKKIEKLQKKIEQNRGYMKEHEDYYKNKADREAVMKKNDRDQKVKKIIDNTVRKIEKANKKIEKANEKFEKQSSRIEKHNERQLENSPGRKLAKEDALKAEIKIKKLLAKENGGKYRYKDMTDEEKEYYRKNVEKKIATAAWVTLLTASAVAGAYKANELRKPDDYSEYGINQKPSKETRKEIAKGQLERAKEMKLARERVEQAKENRNEANKKAMEIADKHWRPEEKSIRLAAQKEADEAEKEFKKALANEAKVQGYDMLMWGSQPGHAKHTRSETISDEKKRDKKGRFRYETPWYLEDD